MAASASRCTGHRFPEWRPRHRRGRSCVTPARLACVTRPTIRAPTLNPAAIAARQDALTRPISSVGEVALTQAGHETAQMRAEPPMMTARYPARNERAQANPRATLRAVMRGSSHDASATTYGNATVRAWRTRRQRPKDRPVRHPRNRRSPGHPNEGTISNALPCRPGIRGR